MTTSSWLLTTVLQKKVTETEVFRMEARGPGNALSPRQSGAGGHSRANMLLQSIQLQVLELEVKTPGLFDS